MIGRVSLMINKEKLQKWFTLNEQSKELKRAEMELRNEIFAETFNCTQEGGQNVPIGGGFVLKSTLSYNRKINEDILSQLEPVLAPLLSENGLTLPDLIRYKPALNVSIYKKLPDDVKLLVEKCLETKPGSPTLKIEPISD